MQNRVLKFILVGVAVAFHVSGYAQTSLHRLHLADSLYSKKMYTQSFEHYETILKNNEYTPAMLLKMAYIQEGLHHIGQSLYFLNLYYRATHDAAAVRKMEELAEQYNLQGYQTSDSDWLLTQYHQYHTYISLVLLSITILLLALVVRLKFRLRKKVQVAFAFFIAALAIFSAHLNFSPTITNGIIANTNTYIMSGPSPGADLVEIVGEGHRLKVTGKSDVWLKVEWNGSTAYIKNNNVLPVTM